ncbi:hypothetical protein K493DRAFT_284611 [Basidiobolus meristosporus CBS 931.73]|uniref:Pyridoxamine 5'-phosphate oxidase putative domain-containing protein n=1 Tax=Basidiobolus meristosporus CBS 931.73 TaxID=1314790 RepID=A0A1Y1Y6C6_9FUNG|nr:hypothetical protein K493DRAFT_284611 [Basidiobolus meristosporus CBS 931.73]|eukprot:ORX93538.1 hypothetical protein K493DRAFT_284611 [Basidiobolus meristosporus CBS 931.73]
MGQFFQSISSNTRKFVTQQQVFWVASAPLSSDGHVNVSPKGTKLVVKEGDESYSELDAFWVINENQVGYFDFYGSGVETLSHLREAGNGRITIQFNAFEGSPRIIRLFGHGKAYDVDTPEFVEHLPMELKDSIAKLDLVRSIIIVDVNLVGSSCGYGVPFMSFDKHRINFTSHIEKKKKKAVDSLINDYRISCGNSIDSLPPYPTSLAARAPLSQSLPLNQNLYVVAAAFALGMIVSQLFSLAL